MTQQAQGSHQAQSTPVTAENANKKPIQSPNTLNIFVNRASRLFKKAAENISVDTHFNTPDSAFSYWVEYYGLNPNESPSDYKLMSPKIYNLAESKAWVAKQLIEKNITTLFPATFFSVDEALNHPTNCNIFFSKPAHLSGGRGIECIARNKLTDYTLPDNYILQEAIENISLIDGRKYTGRIYLFIWNKQAYLFDDGFILIHGHPYNATSTSYDVHVNHNGYEKDDSEIEMRLLSSLDDFTTRMAQLTDAAQQLEPVIEELLAASSTKHYLMLGIDFLLQNNNKMKFIEINSIPNFIHATSINENLNTPFFENSMRLMLDMPYSRLQKIF